MFSVLKRGFPGLKSFGNRSAQMALDMNSEKLRVLPDVKLDEDGDYKYILVRVSDRNCAPMACKFVVRGTNTADYHDDIYQELKKETKTMNLHTEPAGGGRITFDPKRKNITIYDRSMAFGRADHDVTKRMLEDHYMGYNISVVPE